MSYFIIVLECMDEFNFNYINNGIAWRARCVQITQSSLILKSFKMSDNYIFGCIPMYYYKYLVFGVHVNLVVGRSTWF